MKVIELIKRFIHWAFGIADKADDALAKAAVFIVDKIQPILFSPTADILSGILDAVTKSQLPDEILDELRKWVPIFLTTQGIIHSITPESTKEEINAELIKIVQAIPGLTHEDRAKLWTSLAASIYIVAHEIDKGETITFGQAATIVEEAYEAYLSTKKK